MPLDATLVPHRPALLTEVDLGEELVIYRHGATAGLALNPSARGIWSLCDGRRSVAEVCRELANRLGIDPPSLLPDVGEAVARLAEAGVLVLDQQPTPGPFAEIDWERIAEPRSDLYDTQVVLGLVRAGATPGKCVLQGAPAAEKQTLFAGNVAIRHSFSRVPEELHPAPLDHVNVKAADRYMRRWPAGFEQFTRLMNTLHPLLMDGTDDDSAFLRESRCHSVEEVFGELWSTVNCPLMLAENCVHEMGHQKLFALGVYKESSARLITNRPSELFKSPVIKNRLRPMTAVFHAAYSFTYVCNLDLEVLRAEADSERRGRIVDRLRRNLAKVDEAMAEVNRHVRVDDAGAAFLRGHQTWLDRLHQGADSVAIA